VLDGDQGSAPDHQAKKALEHQIQVQEPKKIHKFLKEIYGLVLSSISSFNLVFSL